MDGLPEKLNTNVGNRGVSISGGQKQRVGIARALYRDSQILILDEATNSLDFENEKQVIDQIISIKDITVLIIAHNISSLKSCDKILYLEQGKIKDFDSYEKIMSKYNLI